MIARLAYAYGTFNAVLGCMAFVVVGQALEAQTLGVTRTPLPLVWPLAVLHVAVAQIPLRDVMGPAERIAVRGRLARGARGGIVAILITVGGLTYVSGHGSSTFTAFYVVLAAVAFAAPALSAADPWPWTLGLGMTAVGLQFVTPWEPVTRLLEPVPPSLALLAAGLAVCCYVLGFRPRTPAAAGLRRPRRRPRVQPSQPSGR